MADLMVGDVNISQLSDDDLYNMLKDLGVDVGPVVESTRSLYERKLANMLQGPHRNDNAVHEDYSDTDEEAEELNYNSESTPAQTPSSVRGLNVSPRSEYEYSRYSYTHEESTRSNIQPRVSLSGEFLRSRSGRVDDFVSRIVDQEREPARTGQSSASSYQLGSSGHGGSFSTVIKVGIFVIILLVALLVYQNMEGSDSSPIAEITLEGM